MRTVLRSASSEVAIGPEEPFCIIGERITLGASNVSLGLPNRHALGAAFLALAPYAGLTSAIMDARNTQTVDACRASDLLLGRDDWAMSWIAAHRQAKALAG